MEDVTFEIEHRNEPNPVGPVSDHRYAQKRKRNLDDKEADQSTSLSNSKTHICPYCQLELANRQSLFKHKQRKHPQEKAKELVSGKIHCPKCKEKCCQSLKDLLIHQNEEHQGRYEIHHAEFDCEEDFKRWKVNTEKQYGTWFVKTNGDKKSRDHVTSYFYCNRSGQHRTRGKGKKALKSQGSSKIGGCCCSFLTKTYHISTGKINVEYSLDYSLGSKIAHLKMSLASGVGTKKVLDDIRDNMTKLDGQDSLDLIDVKKAALDKLAEIVQFVESAQDVNVVQDIVKCLDSALAVGKGLEASESKKETKVASVSIVMRPSAKESCSVYQCSAINSNTTCRSDDSDKIICTEETL